MQELWFVAGLACGMVLMAFCAIGSFDRGADSARRGPWKLELVARKRASIAASARPVVITPFMTDPLSAPRGAAALVVPASTRSVPAAERRTRIQRSPDEVLAVISL